MLLLDLEGERGGGSRGGNRKGGLGSEVKLKGKGGQLPESMCVSVGGVWLAVGTLNDSLNTERPEAGTESDASLAAQGSWRHLRQPASAERPEEGRSRRTVGPTGRRKGGPA